MEQVYEHLGFNFKSYEDKHYFYFTMPYFEGELFHYAISYNLKSRFQIIQSLISTIKNIHSKGLIHRDLKCDNISINKNAVHIIDLAEVLMFLILPVIKHRLLCKIYNYTDKERYYPI